MDPVVKPFRSAYDAFSNNPINRVDPNGDDDFFDTAGNFLFSTPTGNNIRIVTNSNLMSYMILPTVKVPYRPQVTDEKQIKIAVANSVDLSNYTWSMQVKYNYHKDNFGNTVKTPYYVNPEPVISMFTSIMEYYANSLNLSRNIYVGIYKELSASNTFVAATGKVVALGVSVNFFANGNPYGQLSSENLSDINDFKSILVHEEYHFRKHQGIKTEGGKRFEVLAHLDAYAFQFTHFTWKNTTKEFKTQTYKNVRDYINKLDNIEDRKSQMSRFNKLAGKEVLILDNSSGDVIINN